MAGRLGQPAMRHHPSRYDLDDLSEHAFLAGPDRAGRWEEGFEEQLYSVNDAHERAVWEILEEHPADRTAERRARPSRLALGYRYSDHADGVILRCPKGRIAGVYLGLHLALHVPFRGRGLGTELVVDRALRDGGLPGWELDPPAYTRAGLRAHRSAWRWLQEASITHFRETVAALAVDLVATRPCAGSVAHA